MKGGTPISVPAVPAGVVRGDLPNDLAGPTGRTAMSLTPTI
jgi:hypothetical protein